jgi:hypothetical protein
MSVRSNQFRNVSMRCLKPAEWKQSQWTCRIRFWSVPAWRVNLTARSNLVDAQAENLGRVCIPAVVQAGQATSVYLDGTTEKVLPVTASGAASCSGRSQPQTLHPPRLEENRVSILQPLRGQ